MKHLRQAALLALIPSVGFVFGRILAGDLIGATATGRSVILIAVAYGVSLILAYGLLRLGVMKRGAAKADEDQAPPGEAATLASSTIVFVAMGSIGWFVAERWGTAIPDQVAIDGAALFLGLGLTVPPMLMLRFIMTSDVPAVRAFREKQIQLFVDRGFDVGWLTIITISVGAGLSVEILFRGALQPLLQGWTSPLIGLVLASVLFGLAHAANWTYILITAAVGVYLGAVLMMTNNLLVPIISHAAYDIYALAITVRAVRARKESA